MGLNMVHLDSIYQTLSPNNKVGNLIVLILKSVSQVKLNRCKHRFKVFCLLILYFLEITAN